MEIERQFLIELKYIGFDIETHPKKLYVQAYISTNPAIRLRQEGDSYVLCVKGHGYMVREEFELPLDKPQYDHLWKKIETGVISKHRYFIPLETGHKAELDVYMGNLSGLCTVEVEFNTIDDAESFTPPKWFGEEVTNDSRYKNVTLAMYGLPL